MSLFPDVVFVGQGPNRSAWEHGLLVGRRFAALRLGLPEADPKVELPALGWAESYCRRVSLTGAAGRKLAGVCELPLGDFLAFYARRNLNARFNGKAGKGDAFRRDEGEAAAGALNAAGFRRFVLLGAHVARCFGFRYEQLRVHQLAGCPRTYLVFPHPSGVNAFWNDPQNRRSARAVLRGFLELDEPTTNPKK